MERPLGMAQELPSRVGVRWPAAGMAVREPCISCMRDLYHFTEKLSFSGFGEVKATTMASSLGGKAGVKAMFSGIGGPGVLWYL